MIVCHALRHVIEVHHTVFFSIIPHRAVDTVFAHVIAVAIAALLADVMLAGCVFALLSAIRDADQLVTGVTVALNEFVFMIVFVETVFTLVSRSHAMSFQPRKFGNDFDSRILVIFLVLGPVKSLRVIQQYACLIR